MQIEELKNIVDYGIIGILVVMSFTAIAFAIERFLSYRSIKPENYESKTALELDLMRRLPAIATIGANAPYIGLLGTVLAIILTFYVIGEKGSEINPAEVMKHLALALKATAAGLLVAIPSTILYNLLIGKVDRLLARWDIAQERKEH